MQNKGVIRLLAILLFLVCLYQLSFTYKTWRIKQKAEEYAQGDLAKELYYLDSIAGEEVFNFLGLRKYTFRECQQREINLGLDLKGGMSVILEVSVIDVLNALSNYTTDTTYAQTINMAVEMQKNSQEDFVTLFGRAFDKIAPGGKLAQFFYGNPTLKGRIDFNSSNEDVLSILLTETKDAIDNSFNVLRNRIDQFGVAQPNIQRLEAHGRIMVELPGVKNPERVRKLLQSTAQLEFWETYENAEVYQWMLEANKIVKQFQDAQIDTTNLEPAEENDVLDILGGEENESNTLAANDTSANDDVSLLDEIESDTSGADTSAVQNNMMEDYPLFSLLIPYVSNDNKLLPGSIIGRAHSKDIKKIEEYLENKRIRALFPRDIKFIWSAKPPKYDESQTYYELHAIKMTGRDNRAPLDGDVITNARAEFGQNNANAEVTMTMNGEGAKIWARLTRENVGKHIAIVLDNRVYSSPRVNQEIKGGNSQITGDFDVNEAKDLANVLKSGKLPAPAKIIQEAIVGPSLGLEAVTSGMRSFAIAFLMILVYMILYYNRKAGLIADIALLANMFFIIGVLASLGAVLTLPGIAGIVLTIGMSVDANVLIFERIREEVRAGKGIKLALRDGYKNAYSAIIDGNVTTLLTGIVLYLFGTGPIKGFATTLIIGILTSLFSAIFITRLIFERLLDKNNQLTFSTKITENAFANMKIQFLEKRKIFFVISAIVIAAGIFSLVTRGLNLGVDFSGGRTFIVKFDQPVKTTDIKDALKEQLQGSPDVIIFGQDNQVRITTKYKIDDRTAEVDEEVEQKIYAGLKPLLPENTDFTTFIENYKQRSEKIGPTIADDIKKQAVWAVSFAIVIIFIYILARFRKWQYSLGATVALIHDAFIIIGIFSMFYGILPFSLEIDQAFIAAILTIVGYSINDTVIVFDRIRENVILHPKQDLKETINMSLNSTLGRTFNTSFTTILVLLAIFLFGGEVIRGFVFALLVGIIVGTYSSLFIASPIAYNTIKKKISK